MLNFIMSLCHKKTHTQMKWRKTKQKIIAVWPNKSSDYSNITGATVAVWRWPFNFNYMLLFAAIFHVLHTICEVMKRYSFSINESVYSFSVPTHSNGIKYRLTLLLLVRRLFFLSFHLFDPFSLNCACDLR